MTKIFGKRKILVEILLIFMFRNGESEMFGDPEFFQRGLDHHH